METYENDQAFIKTWYELSIEPQPTERGIFLKFFGIWVAFNALYKSHTSNGHTNDEREMIANFSLHPENIAIHDVLLKDAIYLKSIDFLRSKSTYNVKYKYSFKLESYDLKDIIEYIYIVRNNLFHGDKTPDGPRNSSLVEACYNVISLFVGLSLRG